MANMIKDLLAPEQAKLLDDQLRKQSLQQGVTNYGNDSMGKFLTAASGAQRASEGFGMAAQRAIAGRQMGANETGAVQAQQQQQVMADALKTAEGKTQSERLLNAAEKLEKTGLTQAVMKATQLREQAAALAVQEEQLNLQRKRVGIEGDRVSVNRTEAENRATTLRLQEEQQKAQNELAQQRITASTTTQQVTVDSEGNRFNMITTEGGEVKYVPLGEAKAPVGEARTVNEITVDSQIKARNDLQFNKEFLESRKEAVTAFKDTKKVFSSADNAYKLLQELQAAGGSTGGIVAETERKIKRYLGIADDKSVPSELLKKELGMAIAANLKATFGGSQITDSERKFLEANMISIEDTPEVILRKLKASMEVSKSGMEKLTKLSSAKGYTDFVAIQNDYIEQDYLDVQDKYELNFGSVGRANSLEQMTPDQIAAKQAIQRRAEEKARQSRRGQGAR
ncbi:hypothetical protein [Paraglaciecola sp.]|uniref:hypothetical protein n=1 Tax=Paraglaciecola sp. TaxID=1920173 RepID=UPI003EF69DE6